MKRILLYTVCGLAMLTMFNSCHIYNKYHRPDVDVEGLFRDTVAAGDTLAADSLNTVSYTHLTMPLAWRFCQR